MRSWWLNSGLVKPLVSDTVVGITLTAKWYLIPGLSLLLAGCATVKSLMAVNVPLTDLRAQPHTIAQAGNHDPLQETQLLYGERVRVLKAQEGWASVQALEQPEFTHAKRWQGYPGWLPVSALVPWEPLLEPNVVVTEKWAPTWEEAYLLKQTRWRFPLGTRLRTTDMGGHLWKVELLDGAIVWMPSRYARSLDKLRTLPIPEKRQAILRSAQLFIGDPYFWGGRSPHVTGFEYQVSGVDCSGLINLAYRSVGIEIPRDAHEQFLRAKAVQALQPADMIFLSERGNPKRIVHVMLYAGDGDVIEGPGTGQAVRRISLMKRLGHSLGGLAPGTVIDGQTVFFGTYLP